MTDDPHLAAREAAEGDDALSVGDAGRAVRFAKAKALHDHAFACRRGAR